MFHTSRHMLAGREHVLISLCGTPAASLAEEVRAVLTDAVTLIATEGFDPRHIVRSRIFARDTAVRQVAGDIRLQVLAGDLRGASSSYIDPDRLPARSSLRVDLVAQRAAPDAVKHVEEYDPVIAPPMFVTLDGMVYLSGMTDTAPGFDAQLERIATKVGDGLTGAGAGWGRVVGVRAYAHRSVSMSRAWSAVTGIYPGFGGPLTLTPVAGFTTPEKRIEIETTARI